MPKWWKHWLFENVQAEEAEHTFGIYLGVPEYLYQGEYLEFSIRDGIQVVEIVQREKDYDSQKKYLAVHLKEAKENSELPYRFWENIVMRDSLMREIIENLPEKSEDKWWLPTIMA